MANKFHRAARDGYLDSLRDATKRDMNTTDEDGRTPAMLASAHGNLDALRIIVMRGGHVNMTDVLGNSPLHYACRNGHLNCVSYLVNYGANFWIKDNDFHTPLDIAGMENREEIVKFLDEAQTMQQRKNPKFVQQQKEKALKEAERKLKIYEKLQDKASKEMEKSRKKMEREDSVQNGDFKAPTSSSFFKTLTFKKKGNTAKTKPNGVSVFSDLVNGSTRGRGKKLSVHNPDAASVYDFHVSETDSTGKRTIRSVKGTIVRNDAQVLYMANSTGEDIPTDNSSRPKLANVFPGTELNSNKSKSDPNLVDSGVESFDGDETPGMFSRPNFGEISFLNKFNAIKSFPNSMRQSHDDVDSEFGNGVHEESEGDIDRVRGHVDSIDTTGELPWQDEDVEELDDDEDETEYTPVVMFLEGCGLTKYIYLFTNGDVDMEALMKLQNQDFEDIGLPIGPRRKLMDAIQRRRVVLSEPAQLYDSQL